MKKYALAIFIVLIAIGLAIILEQDHSYLLLVYNHSYLKIRLSIVLFLGLFAVVILILFAHLWRSLAKLLQRLFCWPKQHRLEKTQRFLEEGLNALAAGDWAFAEKRLTYLGEQQPPHPQAYLHYLGAALAAQAQNANNRCNDHLKKAQAHANDKQAQRTVAIRQSDLLIKQQEYLTALNYLKPLYAHEPKNPMILKLLYYAYDKLDHREKLSHLLPALRKYQVLPPHILTALEEKLR